MDFNRDWLFQKQDGTRETVHLPHDAMLTEKRDAQCRTSKQSGYFPGGKYTYTKTFPIDTADIGKSIELHFGGVYQNCTVTVNGAVAKTHRYGFTPFSADISALVHTGENTVVVTVDNTLEPNCRWYSGSGIYRPVQLLIRDVCHIAAVQIETLSHSPATVKIAAETTQPMEITVELYDGDTLLASGAPGTFTIPSAKLWSAEMPYLYTCRVVTPTDVQTLVFGIRRLEWSAATGLLVNGEEVLLRGGCIHHDHGVLGVCGFPDADERRVRILKEAGYNAIRCAHNPASREFLEICDRLGMYVMDEAYDGWYIPKNYHDPARFFEQEWQGVMTAMVENARNHPSVIIYSIGNEVSETASEKGVQTCAQLADFVRALDPTRPVTAGVNVLLNVYIRHGMGVYKDKGTYKAEPLPPRKRAQREKKTGSTFFNAMAQKLGPLMFFMSKGKKGDRASFGAAQSLDILGLNYAASRYDSDVVAYPDRMMVGAETIIGELPYNWERVKQHKAIVGDFAWAAWDYLGEAGVGDWTYYSYPGLPLLAGSGAIDLSGNLGAEMYFQQVVWGLRKQPFIGVRPLNHAGETPSKSSWRFTNCIDSWSWQGYEGTNAVVEVYSDAHAVRLSLNGKVIGTKPIKQYKALFRTRYAPGMLTAEALDAGGNVIASHSLTSGDTETVLTLKADKTQLRANGQDLCFVALAFTDANGELKPFVEQRIELAVNGAATLAGFGSALGKTDEVFDKTYHDSYRGRALAVLRAGTQTGKTTITATSAGVAPVTIELDVIEA